MVIHASLPRPRLPKESGHPARLPDRTQRGFTLLIVILVLALMTVLGVGLLSLARTEITTAGLSSDRVRAEIAAANGFEEALDLLRYHTLHGNYITAMPPFSELPADQSMVVQEVYRPYWEPADPLEIRTDRYLTPNDPNRPIVADYLLSLSAGFTDDDARVESRPAPWALSNDPTASPGGNGSQVSLGMPYRTAARQNNHGGGRPWPLFTEDNSYDFNQRTGRIEDGAFLVYPATGSESGIPTSLPAPAQWIQLRDENQRIRARYAWFIEDESMKLNVNTGGSNTRPSDIVADLEPVSPRRIDTGAVLPDAGARDEASQQLIALAPPGERLVSPGSAPLIGDAWNDSNPEQWINFITTLSASDNTTGRGWQRLDLNQVVADEPASQAANTIAEWIRDAWTGPVPIDSLQDHQLYGNDRLRQQVAANIVDYIDADNTPTDLGDINGYPILGIEKIPYLVAFEPRFEHVDLGPSATPGFRRSQLTLRVNLRFYNLFDEPLDLTESIQEISFTGLPIIVRNGADVLDVETETFQVRIPQDLEPGSTIISPPVHGSGQTGAKTFPTVPIGQWTVEYPVSGQTTFLAGLLEIDVEGSDNARLDSTEVGLNSRNAQWNRSGSDRYLFDNGSSGREAAVICLHYTIVPSAWGSTPRRIGDPRYRPDLMNGRWYHTSRSDEDRVSYGFSRAEQNSRAFALDWYQHYSDTPKLFHRNGPMRSIGEIGLVSGCEFPWQTLYLQYPERPSNTGEFYFETAVPERRIASLDWVLADLFTTGHANRVGQWNVNSQLLGFAGSNVGHGTAIGLFRSMQVGGPPHDTPLTLDDNIATSLADVIANRRNTARPEERNDPPRPFHQTGQLAAPLSRAIGESDGRSSSSRNVVTESVYGRSGNNTPHTAIDSHMEQPYRQISEAVTTGGSVFRVLYVGQAVSDRNNDGVIQSSEVRSEHLGEAFVERVPVFGEVAGQPGRRTVDSTYRVISRRPILE